MQDFVRSRGRARNPGAPTARQVAPGPKARRQAAEIRHILGRRAVQPKLKIGAPSDACEREADRVADQVMAMSTPKAMAEAAPAIRGKSVVGAPQRRCADCEDKLDRKAADDTVRRQAEDEEEVLQAKERNGQVPVATSSAESNINHARGSGAPLPALERRFFAPRFGRSFDDVRIHSDSAADQAARSINARAFTLGSDIFFARGEYGPGSGGARRLLAHELTHTVQQDQGATLRRRIGDADDLSSRRFARNSVLENVLDGTRELRNGSRGTHVRLIQESLLAQGYTLPVFGADGIFGAETEGEVRKFQIDAGATLLDGIIGDETMRLLDMHDPDPDRTPVRTPDAPGAAAPTAANFTESPDEPFAGFDASVVPNALVVPETGSRAVNLNLAPAGAQEPTFNSSNAAVAGVRPTENGMVVEGVGAGLADVTVHAPGAAASLATLKVVVKRRRDVTVDYHFMSDNAGHATTRAAASADALTATLNRIWHRQANVRLRKGVADSPSIPQDLGPQVVWTAGPASEWDVVVAFATGGDWNVFLVWEYEQDATPAVDDANAGTGVGAQAGDTLLEDNDCPDGLTLAHEAGHFLSNSTLPHTAQGIMGACGAPNYDRVTRAEADAVNP